MVCQCVKTNVNVRVHINTGWESTVWESGYASVPVRLNKAKRLIIAWTNERGYVRADLSVF